MTDSCLDIDNNNKQFYRAYYMPAILQFLCISNIPVRKAQLLSHYVGEETEVQVRQLVNISQVSL